MQEREGKREQGREKERKGEERNMGRGWRKKRERKGKEKGRKDKKEERKSPNRRTLKTLQAVGQIKAGKPQKLTIISLVTKSIFIHCSALPSTLQGPEGVAGC